MLSSFRHSRGRPGPLDGARRARSGALAGAVPLLIWWTGWFPGFLNAAAVQQWVEIESGEFTNAAPGFHTAALWLVSFGGRAPALASLTQIVVFALLMAVVAGRLTRLAVPWQVAALLAAGAGWLPAVGSTMSAPWPQTAHALAALWAFAELLAVARGGREALATVALPIRLGIALGLMWVTSHTGVVVAVAVGAVLLVLVRDDPVLVLPGAAATLGLVVLVQVALFPLAGIDRAVVPIGEAYAPEVAAVLRHDPEQFEAEDLALLKAVAPLEVWEASYRCEDGNALLADPEFDSDVIRNDPGAYRALVIRMTLNAPETVFGHRACAAAFVFVPPHPTGQSFATMPREIPDNTIGLKQRPLIPAFRSLTEGMLERSSLPGNLWLGWRPGLVLLLALAGTAVAVGRQRLRLLLPALLLVSQVVLVAATVRTPAFSEVAAVYLLSLVSIPLWWPALQSRPLDLD